MTPTQDVRIDRLSLRVPGLDKDAAEDLARLIALRLANDLPVSGNPISDYRISDSRSSEDRAGAGTATSARSSRSSSNVGTALRLEVAAQADLDGLAWRIAGEIRDALAREGRQ